jgi:hypothetical protein
MRGCELWNSPGTAAQAEPVCNGWSRKGILNAMRMKDRMARLESRAAEQSRPKKRALPDWLQASFEREGYLFDRAGQLIACPIHRSGCTPAGQSPIPDNG